MRSCSISKRSDRALVVAGLVVAMGAQPACSDDEGDARPRSAEIANLYPDGHALAPGQTMFLHETFGTEVLGYWPPAEFLLSLMESEPDVFGNQFASFGFIEDPADDFPIGFKRGTTDPAQVHETCALCHVGRLPDGRLWLGAPNRSLDIGRFRVALNDRWIAAGNAPLLTALDAEKLLVLGPGRTSAESSEYPTSVGADFPVYFNLSERVNLNYLGTGQNLRTELFLALYTFGAGNPNPMDARVPFPSDETLAPFADFFGSLDPPAGSAQDPAAVTAGLAVFERERCGSCHHVGDLGADEVVTYDRAEDGRERLPGEDPMFPRGSIRTDYLHRILVDGDGSDGGPGMDEGFADLVAFIFRHGLTPAQTDGYRTSDLRAVWATAPYLHNGSVPTLEDLLRPASERPTTFMRDPFLFDTSVPGNGNGGHEFGSDISDADRAALVAYLRSL